MHSRVTFLTITLLLLGVLGLSILGGIGIGETPIEYPTVLAILASRIVEIPPTWSASEETIVLFIRLPRILLAALVGSGLAVCGAVLQSLFRNPMADPFILGISNGAALGASAILLMGLSLGLGFFDLPVAAFCGGMVTILLVYEIARVQSRLAVTTLLLSGIGVSAFMGACTSLLLFLRNENLHQVIFWMMGGLWGRQWEHVVMLAPLTLGGIAGFLFCARALNAMMFGEESAHYLGIRVEHLTTLLLVLCTLVTGASVAVSGIIGFVGLITPHIVRILTGPDHRILLPLTALTGAIILVVADIIARTLIAPAEMPIGIITAFCGAPFFIYLLKRRGRVA